MKIQRIGQNYISCSHPNKYMTFGSSSRKYMDLSVADSYMQGEISNYTYPFRGKNNLFDYMDYVLENFADKDSINFYCLGCSDGSGAYTKSICMDMSEKLGNKKVYPIIAVDKNEGIINLAKKGRINLDSKDIYTIEYFLGSDQKYFTNPQKEVTVNKKYQKNSWNDRMWYYKSYKVADDLRQKVKFVTGDILETVKTIHDNGNTYISLENTIPYLTEDYKAELAAALKEKLRSGSLVALDEFDFRGINRGFADFSLMLTAKDFAATKMKYLFRRL